MTGPGLHQRHLIQGCDPKGASICLSIDQTPQETHLMGLKTVSQTAKLPNCKKESISSPGRKLKSSQSLVTCPRLNTKCISRASRRRSQASSSQPMGHAPWYRLNTAAQTDPRGCQSRREEISEFFRLVAVLCICSKLLSSHWHLWLCVLCHYSTTYSFEVSEVSVCKSFPTSNSNELYFPQTHNLLLNLISGRITKATVIRVSNARLTIFENCLVTVKYHVSMVENVKNTVKDKEENQHNLSTHYSVINHIKKLSVFCLWIYKNSFHTKLWSNWKKVHTSWTLLHSPLHITKDSLNICFIKWAKCCILLMTQYSWHHSLLLRTLGFFFQLFTYIMWQ